MHIRILGSAAGGGFPQWNCNCANCTGVRQGTINAKSRTQSSIAVSGDGEHWLLFNASPDIRAQLASFAPLQPNRKIRDTGVSAVLLIDSQIDHTTGLLMLREGCPHTVYCTDMVFQDLTQGYPIFPMLEAWNGGLQRRPIPLFGEHFYIPEVPNIRLQAVSLSSKAPPYSPHRNDPHPGDNIGVLITDTNTGGKLFYAPGLGEIEAHLLPLIDQADCLLVDGTLWRDDELIELMGADKRGSDIGHLPQYGDGENGAGGMIEFLSQYPDKKRVLIHINNTNPILVEDSPERAQLDAAGIEVSYDGMDIHL